MHQPYLEGFNHILITMIGIIFVVVLSVLFVTATAFTGSIFKTSRSISRLNAEVEITFPNNKKVKAASGSSMKDAAKKAKFACNYGCEEGKCGSCELKVNGKTKIRSCIAKVPAVGPVILTEL